MDIVYLLGPKTVGESAAIVAGALRHGFDYISSRASFKVLHDLYIMI